MRDRRPTSIITATHFRRIALTVLLGSIAALVTASGAHAATTCQFSDLSDALNVQLSAGNDRAELRVDTGGTIVVASATSVDIACTGGAAATTTIDTVNVSDTSGGGSTVTTIVQPASFSPGKTVEGSGPGSEIEFNVDLGGGFSDRLSLIGSGGFDNWRLGTAGINFNSGNVDPTPDADTPTLTGVDSYAAQAEGGNDQISAQGGVGTGSAFGSPLTLDGGPGNDNLGGANTAPGALGDSIDGGPDTDNLHGFAGSDVFKGSTGANFLDGGSGEDTVSYAEASAPGGVAVDLGLATQQDTGVGSDTFFGVENVIGTNGPDRLAGDGGPNVLRAGEGDDRVDGRGGDDEVAANGGASDGADTLAGGAGDDQIFGGSGVNTLTYADSQSAVNVDLTPEPTFGYGKATGEGNDILFGIQNVAGSPFADTIIGNAQANTIAGGAGGDTIRAVGGPDTVEVRDGEADTASCGTELDTATADRASLDTIDPDCETTSFLPEPEPDPGQGGGDPQTGTDTEVGFDLAGKAKQRVVERGAVVVKASCPLEDCVVAASGRRRLRPVAESLTAGTPERIKLRVKRKQLLKIAAALRDGRKPKIAVIARAADATGNAATDSVTVRARRSR
jgi:hypothetical protein